MSLVIWESAAVGGSGLDSVVGVADMPLDQALGRKPEALPNGRASFGGLVS